MDDQPITPPPEKHADLLVRMEHYQHWWREPLAGVISVGLGARDIWAYGRDAGFTSSLDEILILTGIALIAGVRNLFGGREPPRNGGPQG